MKNSLGKKIAFFVTVPILVIMSYIDVACPICHGTGMVADNNGMENIKVMSVDKRIVDSVQDACTGFIVTKALPVLTIQNLSSQNAAGYLKITLIDLEHDKECASQYVKVQVPKEATTSVELTVVFAFYSADVPTDKLKIIAEPVTDEVEDLVCKGTGRIRLNEYLLADRFSSELTSEIQNIQEFAPDLSHGEPGSLEWLAYYELA